MLWYIVVYYSILLLACVALVSSHSDLQPEVAYPPERFMSNVNADDFMDRCRMGNWEGPEMEDSWLCVGWLADVLELSLCSSFFTFFFVCVCTTL